MSAGGNQWLERSAPPQVQPQIEMRVDADPNRVPSVRVVAADLATRADFDLDAVADLRLAVDEACAALIGAAPPGSVLTCRLTVTADEVVVTVTVPVAEPSTVSPNTFGWRVLTTLADEVEVLDHCVAPASNGHPGSCPSLGFRLSKRREAETL